MPFADTTRMENRIKAILNAAQTWGGAVVAQHRLADEITAARVEAGMKVLKAIASNPQHGYYGAMATQVAVAHDAFLPEHDGEPGVPLIVPFAGAPARAGEPAKATEIDSFRNDTMGVYSRGSNGALVAHNAVDVDGMPSPVACRYSIVGGQFKFTGLSATVPLIQITRTMADTGVFLGLESAVIKLSIPMLLKEGDNLSEIASVYQRLGNDDLVEIASGAMAVSPVPDIATAQKMGEA